MQLDKGTQKNEKNQGFIWFQSVIPAIWVHYSSNEITLRKSQEVEKFGSLQHPKEKRHALLFSSCLNWYFHDAPFVYYDKT